MVRKYDYNVTKKLKTFSYVTLQGHWNTYYTTKQNGILLFKLRSNEWIHILFNIKTKPMVELFLYFLTKLIMTYTDDKTNFYSQQSNVYGSL